VCTRGLGTRAGSPSVYIYSPSPLGDRPGRRRGVRGRPGGSAAPPGSCVAGGCRG